MNNTDREKSDWLVQVERQRLDANVQQRQKLERPRIHYTKLPEDRSNGPIASEWNLYRREVGRLLAEGNLGRWVVIHGEEIIGIWDTEEEANQLRLERFFMQHVLMKQILEWEPVIRGGGYNRQWH
jgi:hypothetical protein